MVDHPGPTVALILAITDLSQPMTPWACERRRATMSGMKAGMSERSERWEGPAGAGWLSGGDAPGPIVHGFR